MAVLERFGRFHRILEPGLQFKLPFIDQVAYTHSLKEEVHEIPEQTAITADNVKVVINSVLYYKVVDAKRASYEIKNPIHAISLLAQTCMRSQIGILELDKMFEARDNLNAQTRETLNEACRPWGLEVMRTEIKEIRPP